MDGRALHAALNFCNEGDVLVVSNEEDDTRALMGEVMMAYLKYTKKIAGIIHVAIMLAFMLTIFVISCKEVPRFSMMETSPALRISMFIPKSSILFGSGIISFQLLWKLADSILGVKEDEANG